jgi:FkbH-like protein
MPPFEHIWNPLRVGYDITFSSIGNLAEVLEPTNMNKLVVFIHILSDNDFQPEVDESKIVESRFSIIRQRLMSSRRPFLLCFSSYKPLDIVTKSREPVRNAAMLQKIQDLCLEFNHLYVINLDELFAESGYRYIYSARNWYFANSRFTDFGWEQISQAIVQVLTRITSAPKKVLILDCDNTLWGGVIGEDGISEILLGQDGIGKAFKDFQSAILEVQKKGTLLALASKNNEDDVWNVFDNHTEMRLKREHIFTSRINWNTKTKNLQEMAEELNLGLESFVFWDDNPLERDQMLRELPEVTTVLPPNSVDSWPTFLRKMPHFARFHVTKEDLYKQEQYKNSRQFKMQQSQGTNLKDYLRTINLSAQIIAIEDHNLARAEQISMKTNQFNLRCFRYTRGDIEEFLIHKSNFGFLVNLKDTFGDHGLVALVLVRTSQNLAFIESLNISCRVFGRKLEFFIADHVGRMCEERAISDILFEHIPTPKNQPVVSPFLNSKTFTRVINPDDARVYFRVFSKENLQHQNLFLLNYGEAAKEVEGIYEQ